jgi:trimeric autotransporter adhesin
MGVKRRWLKLALLSLAGTLGALACADEDAGRFGADGTELAEFRQEPGPALHLATDHVTLAVNESLQLTATHHDRDGVESDVSAEAAWSSDDPTVAWVMSGTIVGVFPGITQVRVRHGSASDSVAVAVTTQGLRAIEVEPSAITLAQGLTTTLHAIGVFRADARRDITQLVRWGSSDRDVAAIDGNSVRARGLGTATLAASLDDVTGAADIVVTGARLLGLEIVRQRESMALGSGQQLRALGSFSDETTFDITDLAEWGSDDGNLATVDENGLVYARSAGEVGLWARYLGHVAQTSVVIAPGE